MIDDAVAKVRQRMRPQRPRDRHEEASISGRGDGWVFTPKAELRFGEVRQRRPEERHHADVAADELGADLPPELIEHLKDAVASRNLAKVEAIRLEFHRRPDREDVSIPWRTTFAKLEFPAAVAAKRTIGKIGSMAMFSEQRFLEATTGRPTNPADRMTAAKMAA